MFLISWLFTVILLSISEFRRRPARLRKQSDVFYLLFTCPICSSYKLHFFNIQKRKGSETNTAVWRMGDVRLLSLSLILVSVKIVDSNKIFKTSKIITGLCVTLNRMSMIICTVWWNTRFSLFLIVYEFILHYRHVYIHVENHLLKFHNNDLLERAKVFQHAYGRRSNG